MVFVVLDDTGFGQLGCYGSPIATPTFDSLAAGGLRFTSMSTTALCSPSRSCIVTGRNHHANGMAAITELASGYPGYNGVVPRRHSAPQAVPRVRRFLYHVSFDAARSRVVPKEAPSG